jgi:hypothetical protein
LFIYKLQSQQYTFVSLRVFLSLSLALCLSLVLFPFLSFLLSLLLFLTFLDSRHWAVRCRCQDFPGTVGARSCRCQDLSGTDSARLFPVPDCRCQVPEKTVCDLDEQESLLVHTL